MRPVRLALAALAATLLVPAGAASAAEVFAGLTNDARLIVFQSDSPGAVRYSIRVTGLQPSERLVGIDTRRLDGRVYALGSSNRLYVLNLVTGQALAVNAPFSPPLDGTRFAFAFEPGNDAFRVVSDTGQNLRIAAATGQVATVESRFSYAPGDINQESPAVLSAIGFSNPTQGATTTTLYGIDPARGALVQSPSGQSFLRTIGPLNLSATDAVSLDFTANGLAYAAIVEAETTTPALFRIDPSTGAATATTEEPTLALIASRVSSGTTREQPIVDMAALGGTPDDEERPRVSIATSAAQRRDTIASQGVKATVSCSEACRITGSLRVGRESFDAVGQVRSTAGSSRLSFRFGKATRARIRSAERPFTVVLRVQVTDAAGLTGIPQTRRIRVLPE